ncbi:helix-hairpin-helix domain-containing protein [Thermoactinomyces mirandus]|uniref:Helix-hairpin-helix domain-containing protein n=1 Tax=Thermoactinomyces mirandus TaxID=2756294 RepID=A0A7W1XPA8_9BACL|nr:helix-hairpin-helix domain-containing protein [Thermoactinomyces mirandus]MBA4600789.1 helix-hairpin-helix domain-containing protein [Thermoactinomyces mirandus]
MVQWEWDLTSLEKKLVLVSAGLGLALVICLYFLWRQGEPAQASETPLTPYQPVVTERKPEQSSSFGEEKWVVVDVKGAVRKPGIYRLDRNSRVHDAIGMAGGTLPQADLMRVNLAERLSDGKVVYVAKKGEEVNGSAWTGQSIPADGSEKTGKININTATAEELEQLDGIGPKKAQAIMRYREENGPFSSVDEIAKVPGIGEKMLDQFRDQIILS